jgi:hypothetical protein
MKSSGCGLRRALSVFELTASTVYIVREFIPKSLRVEPLGISSARRRVNPSAFPLKALDGIHQRSHSLFGEQDPGWRIILQAADGLERASLAIGQDWGAARLRFQRSDPEVFLGGKDKGLRATKPISQNIYWLLT